ncbi:unnamed protein product [Blepharisma stoltei]|uniref:60S ribosomal protein L32 n=1 Tax=Blepharisma stoltei TaxID=1481888 RepID=A0AAU9IYU1_9CILI|nr:unnamed protein product [Blepharisma stoltei]CAG9333512.1 unnamed protein product [Blepharisma stoltei]
MATPLVRQHKIKKHRRQFWRFQSDKFKRVGRSWRQPHGIDNRVRRKYRGNQDMPGVGFGTDKTTRFVLPNGFKKFLIHNEKELEVLLMHNRSFCAELAHSLSTRTRKRLIERAAELDIRVTNASARLRTEEKK